MNDWNRLNRMAEHYKAEYPSGTRIMLLSMGEDIHRIGDNTRGTVMAVDDTRIAGWIPLRWNALCRTAPSIIMMLLRCISSSPCSIMTRMSRKRMRI